MAVCADGEGFGVKGGARCMLGVERVLDVGTGIIIAEDGRVGENYEGRFDATRV